MSLKLCYFIACKDEKFMIHLKSLNIGKITSADVVHRLNKRGSLCTYFAYFVCCVSLNIPCDTHESIKQINPSSIISNTNVNYDSF